MNEKIYVAGGVYRISDGYINNQKIFSLVHPTDGPPYVTRNPDKLFRSTCHHAHLYEVIDKTYLVLARYSHEAYSVGAPHNPELTPAQLKVLQEEIDKENFIFEPVPLKE